MTWEQTAPPTDEVGAEAEFWLGFKTELGHLSGSVDRLATEQNRARQLAKLNVPGDFDAFSSGVYPASGSLVLNLGGPSQGRIWEVRNWSCGAQLWTTAAAGSALIGGTASYGRSHGGTSTPTTQPLTTEVQDALTTLPGVHTVGTRQIVVLPNETLAVVITGGTPALTYVAHAYVLDYDQRSEFFVPGAAI